MRHPQDERGNLPRTPAPRASVPAYLLRNRYVPASRLGADLTPASATRLSTGDIGPTKSTRLGSKLRRHP